METSKEAFVLKKRKISRIELRGNMKEAKFGDLDKKIGANNENRKL